MDPARWINPGYLDQWMQHTATFINPRYGQTDVSRINLHQWIQATAIFINTGYGRIDKSKVNPDRIILELILSIRSYLRIYDMVASMVCFKLNGTVEGGIGEE